MTREGMEARLSGPMFNGSAKREMTRYTRELEERIGDVYTDAVVDELKRVVRNPTPWYWLQVRHSGAGEDIRVHDGGAVYGPWLAGVSRRNATSRFKGYQHWRRATQRVRRRVRGISVELFNKYRSRLGG